MTDLRFPTAYAFLTEYEVKPNQFIQFREAASRIAAAYNRSAGVPWTAYATFAGPSSSVYVVVPLERLDSLDDIPPLTKVLSDEHGDAATLWLRQFQRSVVGIQSSVVSHVDYAGRPGEWGSELPPFLYYTKFAVKAERTEAFNQAAALIARAHREHDEGLPWFAYSTLAGAPVIHGFLPLGALGELTKIQRATRVVLESLGEHQGLTVLNEFQGSITISHSAVLQHLGHLFGGSS